MNDAVKSSSALEKYRNPDPRCSYPFEPCGAGYCWSYAHHVDGTAGYENMESICPDCECFTVEDAEGAALDEMEHRRECHDRQRGWPRPENNKPLTGVV